MKKDWVGVVDKVKERKAREKKLRMTA